MRQRASSLAASGTPRSDRPSSWPRCALVGSVAAGCYLNGLGGEFVHDDVPAIVLNEDVASSAKTFSKLLATFGDDFWGTPMSDARSHKSYRPLTTLTFRANYLAAGLDPYWFHATNVFLHVLAAILFTKVCAKVAKMPSAFATTAGLIFGVHPIHTEAVTGIVGRADVLACVFFLISLLTYHNSRIKYSFEISLLSGALSILAKETGLTVFVVNLLLDLYRGWHLRKTSDVRWNKEKISYIKRTIILSVAFSVLIVLRLLLLRGSLPKVTRGDNPAAFHPSSLVRFLTFSYVASFNFWLLLCPAHLSHDWQMGSIPLVTSLLDPRNLLTLLILAVILSLFAKSFRRFSTQNFCIRILLGLAILLIPFLPGSNAFSPAGYVLAERVLYIPSMGFIVLVVQGLRNVWLAAGKHRQTLLTFLLFLLIVHALQCVARNKDWRTRESLLRSGVRTLPHNAKMHYNFANFLRDSGRIDLAKAHYRTAIRLWPSYASAYNNLGTLLKDSEAAENYFLLAIKFNEGHLNAHYNLGQLYRKQNRTGQAQRMLEKSIRLSPNFTLGYVELVKLKKLQNDSDVGHLLQKIVKQSSAPEYFLMYGDYLQKKGNCILALKYFSSAISARDAKLEAFISSAGILRRLGSRSRLFQLITRFHVMQRSKRGEMGIQANIYLQRWSLSYELEKHALDYSPAAWTTDGVSGELFGGEKIGHLTENRLVFRYQRCATTVSENVTVRAHNCQE